MLIDVFFRILSILKAAPLIEENANQLQQTVKWIRVQTQFRMTEL